MGSGVRTSFIRSRLDYRCSGILLPKGFLVGLDVFFYWLLEDFITEKEWRNWWVVHSGVLSRLMKIKGKLQGKQYWKTFEIESGGHPKRTYTLLQLLPGMWTLVASSLGPQAPGAVGMTDWTDTVPRGSRCLISWAFPFCLYIWCSSFSVVHIDPASFNTQYSTDIWTFYISLRMLIQSYVNMGLPNLHS